MLSCVFDDVEVCFVCLSVSANEHVCIKCLLPESVSTGVCECFIFFPIEIFYWALV